MTWHYAEGTEQRGPVTEDDLQALIADGKIEADPMVWRDGMGEWQRLSQAQGPTGGAPVAPGIIAGGVVCSECRQMFSPNDVIKHGDAFVCAACKPVFLQKLKEGMRVGETLEYAGFWTRFGAKFVDGLILRLVGYFLGLALAVPLASVSRGAAIAVAMLAGTICNVIYITFFIGKYGATPGKMAAKIRVINADGSDVGYAKACARYFAELLSLLTLCIGYLMVAWDPEKRALHDRICNTRVIKNQ